MPPDRYTSHGSIEGHLQFAIQDRLTGHSTPCVVPEHLRAQLAEALVAGKRIEVSGPIFYRRDGTPARMAVEELRVFPPDSELPKFKDVIGILKVDEAETDAAE